MTPEYLFEFLEEKEPTEEEQTLVVPQVKPQLASQVMHKDKLYWQVITPSWIQTKEEVEEAVEMIAGRDI